MCDSVLDIYTREINQKIINHFLGSQEKQINDLIGDINSALDVKNQIPLISLSRLPDLENK